MITLNKIQRQKVKDLISQNTICAVLKNNKLVWDCNGTETRISKKDKLTGDILRCNEEYIVNNILKILVEDDHWEDF